MGTKEWFGLSRGFLSYLFFFVALFTEILPPPCHFGSTHGVFFGCEVLFNLGF